MNSWLFLWIIGWLVNSVVKHVSYCRSTWVIPELFTGIIICWEKSVAWKYARYTVSCSASKIPRCLIWDVHAHLWHKSVYGADIIWKRELSGNQTLCCLFKFQECASMCGGALYYLWKSSLLLSLCMWVLTDIHSAKSTDIMGKGQFDWHS